LEQARYIHKRDRDGVPLLWPTGVAYFPNASSPVTFSLFAGAGRSAAYKFSFSSASANKCASVIKRKTLSKAEGHFVVRGDADKIIVDHQ